MQPSKTKLISAETWRRLSLRNPGEECLDRNSWKEPIMIKPYVEYTASAVLLNPFGYEFPFDTLGGGATTNKDSTQVLTVKTKLVLAKGRIVMLFKNSHVSCYCDYKDDEEYKVLTCPPKTGPVIKLE